VCCDGEPPRFAVVSSDPRHLLGSRGEQCALEHLERLGYALVARNHRTRFGELDLVVRDERTLVFVEVKTRRASRPGAVWDALDERKRRQVRQMARAYLHDTPTRPSVADIRFDAIGVVLDARGQLVRLEHLEAAF
jgi:putative endonuclease